MSIPQWYAGQVITADRLNARNLMLVEQADDQEASSTSLETSQITVSLEPGAVYAYWLYLSFVAHRTNDLRWQWDTPGTTIASFTQATARGGNTGHNATREVLFRRPAATTNKIAGGTSQLDPDDGSIVTVVQSAYDSGTLFTSAGNPSLTLLFSKESNDVPDAPTTLRGGNQTRLLYQRIA